MSPQQKLAIATNFVLNSPPAQSSNVLDDVRQLVGKSVLTDNKESDLLMQLNKKTFAAVTLPDKRKVLLTPHGELPGGQFLDPGTGNALAVDHKALTATPGGPAGMSDKAAEAMRSSVDAEMQKYVAGVMPEGVVTTYGTTAKGTKIVCCVAAVNARLANFSAGRWSAEWMLELPSGGSVGKLTGKVSCNVHYFEDGNVQLEDNSVFQAEVDANASAFVQEVRKCEEKFIEKMGDIYNNMSKEVLQALRRRLPVTATKYDWDKLSVGRLAAEMTAMTTQ